MTIYTDCLVCGNKLTRSDDTLSKDGSFSMKCGDDACSPDWKQSHFTLWYSPSSELEEYNIELPSGYCINSVVSERYCPRQLIVGSRGNAEICRLCGSSLPFMDDLEYFERKLKTILVFG